MSFYQPALNAYQHGLDQSIEGAFKLASQPTPAQVFLDSLRQREQVDWQRQMQEQAAERAQQEVQRKAAHEDFLFNQLEANTQNKAATLEERRRYHEGVNARGWDRNDLGYLKADDAYELGKILNGIRQANADTAAANQKATAAHYAKMDKAKTVALQQAKTAQDNAKTYKDQYIQIMRDRVAKQGQITPKTLFSEEMRMRRSLALSGMDEDEIDSMVDSALSPFKGEPQPAAPAPTAAAPAGKEIPADLMNQYNSITDPAKKAEAKRRLTGAGYAVP